jgi:hypothetical protein
VEYSVNSSVVTQEESAMRLLVCGGRDFDDFEVVNEELTWLAGSHAIDVIIHGGARGADTLAGEWAKLCRIPIEVYRPEWSRDGRAAGIIRNRRMLVEGKPDMVLAFPGGRGTADMIGQARAAGITVKEVQCERAPISLSHQ